VVYHILKLMKTRDVGRWPLWFLTLSVLACAVGSGCASRTDGKASPKQEPAYVKPSHKIGSGQTYQVRYVSAAKIELDGRADEPTWAQAAAEKHFVFPWKQSPAPATEFRALWDDENFYFSYRAQDSDIVVLENLRDARDAVLEDRVEFYLCRDERMKDCYCVEIDSRAGCLTTTRATTASLIRNGILPGWKQKVRRYRTVTKWKGGSR